MLRHVKRSGYCKTAYLQGANCSKFQLLSGCHCHIAKSNKTVGSRDLLEQAACEMVSLYRYHKIRGWYNYWFYSFKDTGRPKEDNSLSVISQY